MNKTKKIIILFILLIMVYICTRISKTLTECLNDYSMPKSLSASNNASSTSNNSNEDNHNSKSNNNTIDSNESDNTDPKDKIYLRISPDKFNKDEDYANASIKVTNYSNKTINYIKVDIIIKDPHGKLLSRTER